MRRAAFLLLATAPLISARVRAQSDADPSSFAGRQSLRVLLGPGDAAPASTDTFTFEGMLYRGAFQRAANGQIVNLVDLEEYLYSVVSREMPAGWPPAALQAQSVCARTYVLARSDPRRAYDLVPSEIDQVYRGIAGETAAGTAAVVATKSEVLCYGGAFAQVAYSSCCGGHTESSFDAWGNQAITYLEGVVCAWCSDSPHYRWTTMLALEEIAVRLSTMLPPLAKLDDLRVSERDASGRARTFELVTQFGSTLVSGSALRRAVGSRVLPSLLITSLERTPDGGSVSIEGGGLGHGVGLCQWGARGMASQRQTAKAILEFYFPGTVVQNLE
jgi:stage II sporulation protein D